MRMFIAIDVSPSMKKAIAAGLHELKQAGVRGRYEPMANLHQTLAFLGEVREKERVYEALKEIRFKPFKLSLSGYGQMGNALYAAPKGNQGLSALAQAVRSALDAAGISYDTKKFVPHITVMRDPAGNWKQAKPPKEEMTVTSFHIMKSEARDGKRVYTSLYEISGK